MYVYMKYIEFNKVPDWCPFSTKDIQSKFDFDLNSSSGEVSLKCVKCNKKKTSKINSIRRDIKKGIFTSLCVKCRGIVQRTNPELFSVKKIPVWLSNWLKLTNKTTQYIEDILNNGTIEDIKLGKLINKGLKYKCIKCNNNIHSSINRIKTNIKNNKFTCLCINCLSSVINNVSSNGRKTSRGYILIQKSVIPNEYRWLFDWSKPVLFHRYKMSVKLKRKLFDHENVHHIDGNKSNNNIENLELWSSYQPCGQRVVNKIKWARNILDQYKNDHPTECFGINVIKSKIKGVIFDMDGTIVDLVDFHYNTLNESLLNLNFSPIPLAEHVKLYNGLTTKEKLKKIGFDDIQIININNEKQKLTVSKLNNLDLYDPSIEEIFKFLSSNKFKVGIATNSVRNTVDIVVDKMKLKQYCHTILSNENVMYPKPNPEIYLSICKEWGMFPNEVVGVEDGIYGKESVIRAGLNLLSIKNKNDLTLAKIKEII